MSGIIQIYPALPLTSREETCEPCSDRDYNVNTCPLECETSKKLL